MDGEVIWTRTRTGRDDQDCIFHRSRGGGDRKITLDGNFEKPRGSVCAIHNALKYPNNALLFLSDLRDVGNGDHDC